MATNETTHLRLQFLSWEAQKMKHLRFSHQQVFFDPFTAVRVKSLLTDEFFNSKVVQDLEAFQQSK